MNCMVEGNPPLPLDKTDAFIKSIRVWDREYKQRSETCSVFLACSPLFLELRSPPVVTDAMLFSVFGRIPGTQNPPSISKEQLSTLLEISDLVVPQG